MMLASYKWAGSKTADVYTRWRTQERMITFVTKDEILSFPSSISLSAAAAELAWAGKNHLLL
jgi:hypothetical protein